MTLNTRTLHTVEKKKGQFLVEFSCRSFCKKTYIVSDWYSLFVAFFVDYHFFDVEILKILQMFNARVVQMKIIRPEMATCRRQNMRGRATAVANGIMKSVEGTIVGPRNHDQSLISITANSLVVVETQQVASSSNSEAIMFVNVIWPVPIVKAIRRLKTTIREDARRLRIPTIKRIRVSFVHIPVFYQNCLWSFTKTSLLLLVSFISVASSSCKRFSGPQIRSESE